MYMFRIHHCRHSVSVSVTDFAIRIECVASWGQTVAGWSQYLAASVRQIDTEERLTIGPRFPYYSYVECCTYAIDWSRTDATTPPLDGRRRWGATSTVVHGAGGQRRACGGEGQSQRLIRHFPPRCWVPPARSRPDIQGCLLAQPGLWTMADVGKITKLSECITVPRRYLLLSQLCRRFTYLHGRRVLQLFFTRCLSKYSVGQKVRTPLYCAPITLPNFNQFSNNFIE